MERDPAVVFSVDFDLGEWEYDSNLAQLFEVVAGCTVELVEREGLEATIALACEDETRGAMPMTVSLALPADVQLPIDAGIELDLRYTSHGTIADLPAGEHFSMRTPSGGAVLLAGYDERTFGFLPEWSAALSPITVTRREGVCPMVAEEQREAFSFATGDTLLDVLDGRQALLATRDGDYDVVVAAAGFWLHGLGGSDYMALLVRRE
jgi:hypothetical protein